MTGLESLALSAGMSAASGATQQLSYGLGELTGYNAKLRKDQADQERTLTGIQLAANKEQMKYNHDLQYEMWNKTSPAEQLKRIQEAGLNPALMYAGGAGGAGGSTMGSGGGGSAGKGNASDEVSRKQSDLAIQGMGLQNAKLGAELELMEAQAEELRAKARSHEAGTKTTDQQRDILIEKLRQEGLSTFIENVRKRAIDKGAESGDTTGEINDIFGDHEVKNNSYFMKGVANAVLKTMAETDNLNAQKLLANERAKAIWEELFIAQQNADSKAIEAKAKELATMWSTGEFTNWLTWKNLAKEAADLGINATKLIK